MLKSILAIGFLAISISTGAAADTAIPDGSVCKMDLRVSELRRQFMPGGPTTGGPADVHFTLHSIDDPDNPLCQRAMNARQITMNAAIEQIPGRHFTVGEDVSITVSYYSMMAGKMLYDVYHHIAVIHDADGSTTRFSGLGLLP